MIRKFKPKTEILLQAQREIWPQLSAAPRLSFVLYGGTAVALHLGHRVSVDFDFFCSAALDKNRIAQSFPFLRSSEIVQEDAETLVILARMPSGPVKISYFGNITFGHVNEPFQTADGTLFVASTEDLLATKLKTILDRAEARDYRDISAMLAAGVALEKGLGAFAKMFNKDPGLPLRALGFFKDGDLPNLPAEVQNLLRSARDRVGDIPNVRLRPGLLTEL